jgi:hypothetical protein
LKAVKFEGLLAKGCIVLQNVRTKGPNAKIGFQLCLGMMIPVSPGSPGLPVQRRGQGPPYLPRIVIDVGVFVDYEEVSAVVSDQTRPYTLASLSNCLGSDKVMMANKYT